MSVFHLPWFIVGPWLAAQLFPYLSALATKAPTWATGALTLLLSQGVSFLSDVWAQGSDGFSFKVAVVNGFATWIAALVHQVGVTRATDVIQNIHDKFGNKPHPSPHPHPAA